MSGSELKKEARALIRANSPKLLFISIVFIVITAIIAELRFRLPVPVGVYDELLNRLSAGEGPSIPLLYGLLRPIGLVLSAFIWLFKPAVSIGYARYCLKTTRKEEGSFTDLLNGFSVFIKITLISLITTALIILWSLLFFFPGIAAYYSYRQAYYILLDDPGKGIMQCIRESKRLMNGRKVDIFLIDMSFIGWAILSFIINIIIGQVVSSIFSTAPVIPIFPIVYIWLTPYYGLTQAAYYNQVIKEVAA